MTTLTDRTRTERLKENRRRRIVSYLFSAHREERKKKKETKYVTWFPALLLLFLLTTAASTQPAQTSVTVAQALSLLQAHRALDGRIVVVKQNGVDTAVVQPWEFGSGALRVRIARNTAALAEVEKALEDTRQAIVRELLKSVPADADGKPATSIAPGTPQWDELQRQFGEALNAKTPVALTRIKASELKLDRNEIPVTALSAMAPILDDDVSPAEKK